MSNTVVKVTNKVALEFVLGLEEVKANAEIMEKLEKMLEQNNKKSNSGATGKPTKAQEENMKIMEDLELALMESAEPLQIKEIQALEGFTEFTNQKLSALIKKMVDNGKVEKVVEKRISKFKIKE